MIANIIIKYAYKYDKLIAELTIEIKIVILFTNIRDESELKTKY